MRGYLAFNHAKVPAAIAGKIQHRVDRKRQHRPLDEIAALAAEHRFGLGVLAEQAAIHHRRDVFATPGGQFKTVPDQIGGRHRVVSRTGVSAFEAR